MKYRNMAFILPISLLSIGCTSEDIVSILDGDGDMTEIQFSGKVIDGYISRADIFIDLDGNGEFSYGEPRTISDENGTYSFSNTEIEVGNYRIISEGGTDTLTGNDFEGQLISVIDTENMEDNLVMSPVSTLIAEQYFANENSGLEKAKEIILDILDIELGADILTTDFIATENLELFKVNQDVLEAINTISIVAVTKDSSDETDSFKQAIQTILATGTLDSQTNIEKLGYTADGLTSTKNEESSSISDGDIDDNLGNQSFIDLAKDYQKEREDVAIFLKENGDAFISQLEPLEIDPESPMLDDNTSLIVSEIFDKDVANIRSTLTKDFETAKESSTIKDSSEFSARVQSYVDMTTKELSVIALQDFDIKDELDKEIDNLSDNLEILGKSVSKFIESIEDELGKIWNNIDAENISQLPETVEDQDGKILSISLVEQNEKDALVKFSISENGKISIEGEIRIAIGENGDIQEDWSKAETKILRIMEKVVAENGSEFEGTVIFSDTLLELDGNYSDLAEEIKFNGSLKVEYEETPTISRIMYRTLDADIVSTNMATSSDFGDFKSELVTGYSEYSEQSTEEYSEYKEKYGEEYSEYKEKYDKEYSEYISSGVTIVKMPDDYSECVTENISTTSSTTVAKSIEMSATLEIKESKANFKLNGDGGETVFITDFSLENSDNLFLSFTSGKLYLDISEMFGKSYSEVSSNCEIAISEPFEKPQFVEEPRVEEPRDNNFTENGNLVEESNLENSENSETSESSNIQVDSPPSFPSTKSLKAEISVTNSGETPPLVPTQNVDQENTPPMISITTDVKKDRDIEIKELKFTLITETGKEMNLKGDFSRINSLSKFRGAMEFDSIKVKGLIIDLERGDETLISALDIVVNSDEVTDLNVKYLDDRRDSIQITIEDDEYKLFIKNDRKNVVAVDNQGNISDSFQTVE